MAETLETLIVKLIADDSDLEKQLKSIVNNAKKYGEQASKALNISANVSANNSGINEAAKQTAAYKNQVEGLIAAWKSGEVAEAKAIANLKVLANAMSGLTKAVDQDDDAWNALQQSILAARTAINSTNQAVKQANTTTVKSANVAAQYRQQIRNLDADIRRNAVSARDGARQFDALTKEMVQQRSKIDPLSRSYEQLSVQISRSASSADRLRGRINGLSFANQIKSANGFAHSVRTIHAEIAILVGALGIGRLVRGINDASNSYYDAVIAQRLFDRELQKSNIGLEQGASTVEALAKELRTTDDVIQKGAVQLLRYGANLQQAEVLMRAGAASGLAFGRTVSDGIEAIAQAIVGEQSQILNRIGIAGNLSTAYVQYARDLGVSTDALTQQQKVQAALNMILRETASEIEALPILFDGLAGAKNRYSVATTLAARAVGKEFEPALTALYNAGADVVTLFTDKMVPVLAQKLNPLIEGSTDRVTNFITRLTDTSRAGVELRAELASVGVVLGTIGEGFLIAGSYAFGFASDVLGGFAGIGAAIGTLSVQFERFFGNFSQAGLGIQKVLSFNPNDIVAGIALLQNAFKQTGKLNVFNVDELIQSAALGQEPYRKAAQGAYDTGYASLQRLTNLGPNVQSFFDSLAEGGGEGVKDALSNLTDLNEIVDDTGESSSKSTNKVRTFNDALKDYSQGLREINLAYEYTGDKQAALEEQLRLTESTFKELVSLALSDGILSDFERENIKLFADDIQRLTDQLGGLAEKLAEVAKQTAGRIAVNAFVTGSKESVAGSDLKFGGGTDLNRIEQDILQGILERIRVKNTFTQSSAFDAKFNQAAIDIADAIFQSIADSRKAVALSSQSDAKFIQAALELEQIAFEKVVAERKQLASIPLSDAKFINMAAELEAKAADAIIQQRKTIASIPLSDVKFVKLAAELEALAVEAIIQERKNRAGLQQQLNAENAKLNQANQEIADRIAASIEAERQFNRLVAASDNKFVKAAEAMEEAAANALALSSELARIANEGYRKLISDQGILGSDRKFLVGTSPTGGVNGGRGGAVIPETLSEGNEALEKTVTLLNALIEATAKLGDVSPELAKFSEGLSETLQVALDLGGAIASRDPIAIVSAGIKAASFLIAEVIDIFRDRVSEGVKEIASQYELLSEETIRALSKTKKETDFFLFIPYQVEVIDQEASQLGYDIANSIANGVMQGLTDADFNFSEFFDNLLLQLKAQAIINLDATQAFIRQYTLLLQAVLDGTATPEALSALEKSFLDYLNDARSKIGLKPSSPDTPALPTSTASPIQYGSAPSAISFAVNSDFLEGSRNMNKAALLMIDVFGGTAMPEMNLTTAGPDYAAFNSTQQEYVRVTGEFNKMLRRTLDEGFTFNFNGERVSSGSSTLRKR